MKEKIAIIIAIFIIIVSIFFYNLIENNDDFLLKNIHMILPDGTTLKVAKYLIKIIIYVQMYMIY